MHYILISTYSVCINTHLYLFIIVSAPAESLPSTANLKEKYLCCVLEIFHFFMAGGGRMWPLGFVTALGLGISASVGGYLWGNFLFTLSKHSRGPCGPWRSRCFLPMEAEGSDKAPLDLVVIFHPLCQLEWGLGGPFT